MYEWPVYSSEFGHPTRSSKGKGRTDSNMPFTVEIVQYIFTLSAKLKLPIMCSVITLTASGSVWYQFSNFFFNGTQTLIKIHCRSCYKYSLSRSTDIYIYINYTNLWRHESCDISARRSYILRMAQVSAFPRKCIDSCAPLDASICYHHELCESYRSLISL